MAKIFQLELFIKEMSIWKLPPVSEDHDETCVEVTVFDGKDVPINGYVFGKNSTMNRGQNFLFTLSAMPADENKVYFNVFKRAYNREKIFLGSGNIPMNQIFGDLLSQVFKNADATKTVQIQDAPTVSSKNDPQVGSVAPTNDPQPAKKNSSQTKANTEEASKKNSQNKVKTLAASKKNSKVEIQKQDGDKERKQSPQDAEKKQEDANLGSTNNTLVVNQNTTQSQGLPNDPPSNITPIKNLKTVNVASMKENHGFRLERW